MITPITAREALTRILGRAETSLQAAEFVGKKPDPALAKIRDEALSALAALSVQPAREGLRHSELAECRQAIIDARSDDDDADVARSRERLLARINAALSATPSVQPAAPTPTGWRLVPIKPTEAMIDAGWIDKEDVSPREIWHAMLDAAPSTGEG